ncbi:MAG TPA: DUF1552 domain-containing protein [Polyangiaceae bacterium]
MSRRRLLDRRRFIQAAGGMTLALPLLSSLRARGTPAAFPKRLVTMYTPNGQITDAWHPKTVNSETDFVLNECHEPLAAHKERMVLFEGIDLSIADQVMSEGGGPGGPHQRGIGALYTGQHLQTGQFTDGCGSQAGWANGISLDQEVANRIGSESLFKSLELGIRATENDVQGRIAYSAAGAPLPPMLTPFDMYDRIFKDLPNAPADGGAPPEDPQIAQRRSVLQSVNQQVASLQSKVSAEDRQKLGAHLELVRDIERRLNRMTIHCEKPPVPATLDPVSEVDMPAIADAEIDLLALAFACDLSRVASITVSTGKNLVRYPWLSYTNSAGETVRSEMEGHPLSHMQQSDPNARAEFVARARWHAGIVARLFDKLAQIPEGAGTAADNTLLVWCSEVSQGDTHSHVNMPFLVMGGGWHFQTGRYIQCPTGTSHGKLLVSILNAMGVEANTFGVPEFAPGPLTELGA